MLIFITDTETTGLPNVAGAKMIEVAGCLYHVETKTEVAMAQCLIYATENPVENINGISPAMLEAVNPADPKGKAITSTMKFAIQNLWNQADFILAHNASFDRYFLDSVFNTTIQKTWRCSKDDIKFPKASSSRKLVHLAVDHGVFPFAAHRALNDVLTLVGLCKQVPDLARQMLKEKAVTSRYEAVGLPIERKDEAKTRGFRWNAEKKVWWKEMEEAEKTELPFPVQKA